MITDNTIIIRNTQSAELAAIAEMEQDETTRQFILPYTLEIHRREFERPDCFYKSVYETDGTLVGFLVLVCPPDDPRVEFKRIVIQKKGQGYGKRAVQLVDRICTEALGRRIVWLDVFADNDRAKHIYQTAGYRYTSTTTYQNRTLYIFSKALLSKITS